MLFLATMRSGRSRRLLMGISLNIVAANRRRGQSVFYAPRWHSVTVTVPCSSRLGIALRAPTSRPTPSAARMPVGLPGNDSAEDFS